MMRLAVKCMFAPRLFKIYKDGPKEAFYQPQGLEKWTDKVISSANMVFNIGFYTSPFLFMYVLRRGLFSSTEARFLVQCFGGLGCLLVVCIALRGIGRAFNPKYVAFVNTLNQPQAEKKTLLEGLRKYDFEYYAWPVTYSVASREIPKRESPFSRCANPDLPRFKRAAIQTLAYLAVHTFGLRLIYPGSVSVINHILWHAIFQGRTNLVEDYDGQRAKIATADGNTIDTMFIDNRTHSIKGRILVICTEGNSGFYEVGIMTTPAKAGYSVLGWNHPGFAASTGQPYPQQEHNAIEAVLSYAINELGFLPQNIVMYGWSIGGYSAAWAGVNFPVRGLILDATFDDLLPLAENQMPSSWAPLVKEVVRSYVNLNVADLIVQYTGPVQLIRRTEDEIICLRQGYLGTNRGNQLLLRLVESRHRNMADKTRELLHRMVALTESQRSTIGYASVCEHEQRAVRLVGMYMRDFRSNHCAPLSEQHFETAIGAVLNANRG